MAFGKLGARGGFGSLGVLGRAGGSLPVVLPLYTGQLATRSMLMDDKLSFGATNQMMARSRHIARTNITSLAIVIPTWYFSHADGSEVALGGTATATASIEYPIGTFTQIKFGGSVTGTLPDNSNNVSDQTAVVIPTGAVFFVRMFWQSAAGFVLRNANDVGLGLIPQWGSDATNGEGFMQAASGLTDMTMGGTVTNVSNGTNGWCPVAIVGPTTALSIFMLMDSRGEGYGDTYSDASTNIGYGRLVGPSFGYINAGIFALTTGQYIASHTLKNQLAGYCSHVWFEPGYNDIVTGGALATFLTNQQTIIGYFPGKPVFASTIPPGTTSTDAWATTANQTSVSAPGNTSRLSYNNSLRSGSIAKLAGYFELADIAEGTRDSGKWIVNGTANYATGDGVHEKPVMNDLYRTGGAFKTSLIKALWTPFNLGSALAAWWDPADTSKLSLSGNAVTSWNDKKSGISAIPVSGGVQPTWSATARNGAPGLLVNGSQFLTFDSTGLPTGSAPHTILVSGFSTTNGLTVYALFWGTAGSDQMRTVINTASNLASAAYFANDHTSANTWLNSDMCFIDTNSGTSDNIYVDGGAVQSATLTALATTGTGGNIGAAGTGAQWSGVIQQIVIMNRVASTLELAQLAGWESWKDGKAGSNLPGGHLFKSQPPYA